MMQDNSGHEPFKIETLVDEVYAWLKSEAETAKEQEDQEIMYVTNKGLAEIETWLPELLEHIKEAKKTIGKSRTGQIYITWHVDHIRYGKFNVVSSQLTNTRLDIETPGRRKTEVDISDPKKVGGFFVDLLEREEEKVQRRIEQEIRENAKLLQQRSGTPQEKQQAYRFLCQMDPKNKATYDAALDSWEKERAAMQAQQDELTAIAEAYGEEYRQWYIEAMKIDAANVELIKTWQELYDVPFVYREIALATGANIEGENFEVIYAVGDYTSKEIMDFDTPVMATRGFRAPEEIYINPAVIAWISEEKTTTPEDAPFSHNYNHASFYAPTYNLEHFTLYFKPGTQDPERFRKELTPLPPAPEPEVRLQGNRNVSAIEKQIREEFTNE